MLPSSPIRPRTIKAYAILAGGGAKAAALAGALKAASHEGIEFAGFAGTSAGSIVALLAAVGMSIDDLRSGVIETDFVDFLDDSGAALSLMGSLFGDLRSILRKPLAYKALWSMLKTEFGLYNGDRLESFLRQQLLRVRPELTKTNSISFRHLKQHGCRPLKVVVSDIRTQRPLIYSADPPDLDDSVVQIVRASASYPFVFQPLRAGTGYLLDGGLSSNLPSFVFEKERKVTGLPVIAFDLITPPKTNQSEYTFQQLCKDVLATSLDASDSIHRQILGNGIYYIPIRVPDDIGTFAQTTRAQRESLFDRGYVEAADHLKRALQIHSPVGIWDQESRKHPSINLVLSALKALLQEVRVLTPTATNLRARIMFPLDEDTIRTYFSYNMVNDPDENMQVGLNSSWSEVKVLVSAW
jgi:NTE family protein